MSKINKKQVPSQRDAAATPLRLSDLAVALKGSNLVEVNNPFVPGHCYFEAASLSNVFTNCLSINQGAPLVRRIISAAYFRGGIQKGMRRQMDNSHRSRAPSYDAHGARLADNAERAAPGDYSPDQMANSGAAY